MATPYERGRSFEYRVRNFFTGLGFLVSRSPGSRSPFDLIVISREEIGPPDVTLVQCKLDGRLSKKERCALAALASSFGATAILARPGAKRRGVELIQVTE